MQRTITSLLSIALLMANSLYGQTAGQSAQKTVLVPNGAILEFTNLEVIDQATAKVGDRIPLRLIRPLEIDGITLLAEGEMLYGTVTKVHKKIENCGHSHGWVDWRPDPISFPDKTTVKARAVGTVQPGSNPEHPEILSVVDFEGQWVARLDILEQEGLPSKSHVGENIGLALVAVPLTILFAPMILAEAGTYSKCLNGNSGVSPIPEGTTVVVATKKDHRVRM